MSVRLNNYVVFKTKLFVSIVCATVNVVNFCVDIVLTFISENFAL